MESMKDASPKATTAFPESCLGGTCAILTARNLYHEGLGTAHLVYLSESVIPDIHFSYE